MNLRTANNRRKGRWYRRVASGEWGRSVFLIHRGPIRRSVVGGLTYIAYPGVSMRHEYPRGHPLAAKETPGSPTP